MSRKNENEQPTTRIPNTIMNVLYAQKLTGMQYAIVLYVCRKTFGWHKYTVPVSIHVLEKETGFTRRRLIDAVRDLERIGILEIRRRGQRKASLMRVTEPECWKNLVTPMSLHSDVEVTMGSDVDVTRVVTCTSPDLVTSGTPLKIKKKESKKAIDQPLDAASDRTKETPMTEHGIDCDEDDAEDAFESVRRWKEANGHL